MRVGCCGPVEEAERMKDAGFDFIEVNVQKVLRGQDKTATLPDPDQAALPIAAANCLVPGALPVVGPDRDLEALKPYMQRVAERASRLGIEHVVFGSSQARRAPEGYPTDRAYAEIAEFGRLAAEACADRGVTVVLEQLNRKEANTVNTLAEEKAVLDAADHPAFRALVDTYHFGLENEDDDGVIALADRLAHVHVAEPVGRFQPGAHGESDDAFDFERFFCTLRKVGYDGGISFEGKWRRSIEEDGPGCVALLRQAWESAGRCEVS